MLLTFTYVHVATAPLITSELPNSKYTVISATSVTLPRTVLKPQEALFLTPLQRWLHSTFYATAAAIVVIYRLS